MTSTTSSREGRLSALLIAIRANPNLRWKSGHVVQILRAVGVHPVSPGTASGYLNTLAERGHLIRHDDPGCTWYEPTEVTP